MKSRCISLCLAIVLCSLPVLAHSGHDRIMAGKKMGAVSFPVSCSPDVQKEFERGVALLHSFEYEPAQNQFQQISQRDPHCAMAYWGQAMSLYHQLWEHPSKEDLMRGRKLLLNAQQLKPPTAREREYINALAVFYHDADKVA
ncbi:MAG: hypothetical protein ACRD4I_10020, partial [Candidatus Angelobacter sp.]